jgi:hypothetical protein
VFASFASSEVLCHVQGNLETTSVVKVGGSAVRVGVRFVKRLNIAVSSRGIPFRYLVF